ncbi:14611_t:CDS:2, partial [Entrophospora sp. SA101]
TQGMAFYWRNDQLFSRMGDIKQDDMIWTTFLMDTRRKENLPNIGSFGRFLATSLGFTRNLRNVIVYFNDTEVIHLTKETNKSLSINMDIGLNKFSPKNMFQLKSVDVCNVRLHFRGLIGPRDIAQMMMIMKEKGMKFKGIHLLGVFIMGEEGDEKLRDLLGSEDWAIRYYDNNQYAYVDIINNQIKVVWKEVELVEAMVVVSLLQI